MGNRTGFSFPCFCKPQNVRNCQISEPTCLPPSIPSNVSLPRNGSPIIADCSAICSPSHLSLSLSLFCSYLPRTYISNSIGTHLSVCLINTAFRLICTESNVGSQLIDPFSNLSHFNRKILSLVFASFCCSKIQLPTSLFEPVSVKVYLFGGFGHHLDLKDRDPFGCSQVLKLFGGQEMNVLEEEQTAFEIGVVVPKRDVKEEDKASDCVEVLVDEFRNLGLVVERVHGVVDEFIKLAAPLETLGRAAAELHIKKRTPIGMDLEFEWEEVDAFERQPDGSLFSWCERFRCYRHLIYGIINKSQSSVTLRFDSKEFQWEVGEYLLQKLESERIVKEVFPLHDEIKRKKLLQTWALHWWDFTNQPIDEIYSYFGTKIAIYFAFLGMYTRWLLFPAAFGLILHMFDFGSLQLLVLPIFFISIILWAIMFSQFWKRKNNALLARWKIRYPIRADLGYRQGMEWSSSQSIEIAKKWGTDKTKEKEMFQRIEWFGRLMRFRNDAIIIFSIICLQLPFELAYAHIYEVIGSDIMKFGLTTIYLFAIQLLTQIGGKISVKLIKYENNENTEKKADSLVYKVFGLYFMQSYIGVFYHALLHRNFSTLRKVLIQRLLVSQVLENLLENTLPYLKYSYKKYRIRSKKKREKGSSTGKIQFASRVEKEYLKPSYSASIGMELEDGLFDDFLEVALQFGMIMMFACAFPLAFAFATLNNITEIRADALKLLAMLRRPTPRFSTTIGAWLNIFQFLVVMSICTNCALLVWLYDEEGKWKIEPGLAAILVMEHVLLLIKFGFSRFVPEEPAWVKADRVKDATTAENMCSKQLLRNISGERATFGELKKSQ